MATSTLVPLEEYLHSSYTPEREWLDGVVKQKNMPDEYHGYLQTLLVKFIERHSGDRLRCLAEVRIRVSAKSYRVPDVLAIPSDLPFLPSLKVPPTICVEILSADDRNDDLFEKIDAYHQAGIAAIWIVDRFHRSIFTAEADGIHQVEEFRLPEMGLRITSADVFGDLDRLEAL